MQTNRRDFIRFTLAGTAVMSLAPDLSIGAEPKRKIPIAFQLYTVRGEFARNVPETLKRVGQLGYQAVEFWGYAGTPKVYQQYSAGDLRRFLDDSGLKCCGMHLELKALDKEHLEQTMEANQTLGSRFLNVAAAKEKMSSQKGIGELADLLSQAAAQCRSRQMAVGYHAHPFDFEKIEGRFAWDLLFSRLEPEVNMQMDVGNCLSGKGDPIAMLKKFPGRTRTIHIKEHEDKTFASEFYRQVFELCETTSKTEWYIVEMGGALGNGFDVPREAFEKLKQVGKV